MAAGFDVLTLFPNVVAAYLGESILKRAIQRCLIEVRIFNLRDFSTDRHRTVDDYPYGGGSGMVLKIEPVYRALEQIGSDGLQRRRILCSPQGRTFTHRMAKELADEESRLILICGRYEGVDERVRETLVDEEISIGDYVLTGGELAALVIIDSVGRLLPGVLGDESSATEESFSWGILDYPHYTRPQEFMGLTVPDTLLSGNHQEIVRWRRRAAVERTFRRRPDLLSSAALTEEDQAFIRALGRESGKAGEKGGAL